jgi:large subunit ribosomal protein L10
LALPKKQKEALVEDLRQRFARSVSVVMADFSGLDVGSSNELRKRLRGIGAEMKVCKNTLLKRAVQGTPVEVLSDRFVGPNALAICFDDPVGMAKTLIGFAKEQQAFQIRGGMLNGKYVDAGGIEALSRLPSREILLAQLLSVLVATPTGLVCALAGIPRKLLYALKAIEESKA